MTKIDPNSRGLTQRRGIFYRRIYLGKGRDILISLCTDSKNEAVIRNADVNIVVAKIKAGEEFTFPWQNGSGIIEKKQTTIYQAGIKYIQVRRQDGIRESTISIYERALKNFIDVVGQKRFISTISQEDVYKFRDRYESRWTAAFMNINLRSIKTFLIWCKDEKLLTDLPKIKQVRVPHQEPKYLSNSEFEKILSHSTPFMRNAFHFYRETGCRLSEPLNGEIDGNFMVINADDYKTNRNHTVQLSPELKVILLEMKEKNYSKMHYSKTFLKACRKAKVEGKSFHSLRHTFALRCYLRTRDLYFVKTQLGHTSIKTTEIYANFNNQKLLQDFPDLAQKVMKIHSSDELSRETGIAINH